MLNLKRKMSEIQSSEINLFLLDKSFPSLPRKIKDEVEGIGETVPQK